MRTKWTRRQALGGAAALALSACRTLPLAKTVAPDEPRAAEPTPLAPPDASRIFPSSVASGDPTETGAIVWTRLRPEAAATGSELVLEVATDEGFRDVLVTERTPTDRLGAHDDFVVRHDLDGRLAPNRRFFYRFRLGEAASPTGRLRTLPAAGDSPERLRLAVVSCQDYTRGWFHAYDDIAREDVDYVLHLGDFLYETPAVKLPERRIALPSGQLIASSLDDYRALHRAYRSDRSFQRALERHTLIAIWDDHDVVNDRYWDPVENRPRSPDHPFDRNPAANTALHEAAIRAWHENLPVRAALDTAAPSVRDRIRLERAFRFGALADLVLTDNRLRRDPHPCGEDGPNGRFFRMEAKCPGRTDRDRSMLGEEQRRWLVERLAGSRARWKLWANSVPLTSVGYGSGPGRLFLTLDTWAGFAGERAKILAALARRRVENLVSLAGDMHTFFAARLHEREPDPLAKKPPRAVGVELATGALTAPRLGDILALHANPKIVAENNPHIGFWSPAANGYALVEVTPEEIRYEARGFVVDRAAPGVAPEVLGRLRVRAGSTELVAGELSRA